MNVEDLIGNSLNSSATESVYYIDSIIHDAGAAWVYLGHSELGAHYAIKFRPPQSFLPPERFLEEIKRGAAAHGMPNIIVPEDAGVHRGCPWLAAPYVEGKTLDQWARNREQSDKLRCLAKICTVVSGAHRRGLVHRDLKPSNILVDSEDQPWLIDLGCARLAADRKCTSLWSGTLSYASPEQLRNARVGYAADQYSLGIICYELLTGETPFAAGHSIADHLEERAQTACLSARKVDRRIDVRLDRMVKKSTAYLPDHRFASVQEFGDGLLTYLAGDCKQPRFAFSIRQLLASLLERDPSRGALYATVTAALLLVLLLGWWGLKGSRFEARSVAGEIEGQQNIYGRKHPLATSEPRDDVELPSVPIDADVIGPLHAAYLRGREFAQRAAMEAGRHDANKSLAHARTALRFWRPIYEENPDWPVPTATEAGTNISDQVLLVQRLMMSISKLQGAELDETCELGEGLKAHALIPEIKMDWLTAASTLQLLDGDAAQAETYRQSLVDLAGPLLTDSPVNQFMEKAFFALTAIRTDKLPEAMEHIDDLEQTLLQMGIATLNDITAQIMLEVATSPQASTRQREDLLRRAQALAEVDRKMCPGCSYVTALLNVARYDISHDPTWLDKAEVNLLSAIELNWEQLHSVFQSARALDPDGIEKDARLAELLVRPKVRRRMERWKSEFAAERPGFVEIPYWEPGPPSLLRRIKPPVMPMATSMSGQVF